jgi:predicted N-acyltransferase
MVSAVSPQVWRDRYSVEIIDRISSIDPSDWDDCAGTDCPFTKHAHLAALEESGSACPETGFQPSHLVLREPSGRIVAAAPAYVKSHSEAEIGSDMGWPMAHERFCGPYYPKLQVEVALTPTIGPRLLTRPGTNRGELARRLVRELIGLAEKLELSSVHLTFMTAEERDIASELGMLPDRATYFRWENRGYADFEDFLADITHDRRAMIRSERRRIARTDLTIDAIPGGEVSSEMLDLFYDCYKNTYKKYSYTHYLSKKYFEIVFNTMKDSSFLIAARRGGQLIGATQFFKSDVEAFAQHWGCRENVKFLHFEVSCYRGLEYALEHGLRIVNLNSIGQHKAPRGFIPTDAFHAHWFRNAEFGSMIAKGLARKDEMIAEERRALMARVPFRTDGRGAA